MWQQETCQRFLHKASHPDTPTEVTADATGALHGLAPSRTSPAGPCGYWQLAPGVRLRMLRDLCLATLDTYIFR